MFQLISRIIVSTTYAYGQVGILRRYGNSLANAVFVKVRIVEIKATRFSVCYRFVRDQPSSEPSADSFREFFCYSLFLANLPAINLRDRAFANLAVFGFSVEDRPHRPLVFFFFLS